MLYHLQKTRNQLNELLHIMVGAKALVWSPTDLLNIEDHQRALIYASHFKGIVNCNYAAFAMPIDQQSATRISLIRFGIESIFRKIQADYASTDVGSIGNHLFSNIFSLKVNCTFFRGSL